MTQTHVSHLLLIDRERADEFRELSHNAGELYQQFCKLLNVPRCNCYTLVLAFPKERFDLGPAADEIDSYIKGLGARCIINSVADADMMLVKGKAGLLACSLWALAGAVLLNDRPIPLAFASSLLQAANTEEDVRVFDKNFHQAIVGRTVITLRGRSLLNLSPGHTMEDILKRLSADVPMKVSRKPWQFWK